MHVYERIILKTENVYFNDYLVNANNCVFVLLCYFNKNLDHQKTTLPKIHGIGYVYFNEKVGRGQMCSSEAVILVVHHYLKAKNV